MEENKEQNGHNSDSIITTFRLGDDTHPVNADDEVIEYIGARIRALENLESCCKLKVILPL